jgi:HPr kinase/phosphorylase
MAGTGPGRPALAAPHDGQDMTTRISASELFEQQRERLDLRWVAGQEGADHVLEAVETVARRPSLAGYLNAIYPNKVQILGTEELSWLDGLDSRQRWETIQKIMRFRPLALVISKDQACPEDLRLAAEESATPLWSSPKRGHELLNHLQYHLARKLAPRVTLHGVFMEIYSIGVLITGESGSGKSELALELVTRGHRLVADDAPEFTQIAPDVLDGTCPELLQDLLEVRGLGVLNIREMFGDTAVKRNKYLRLVVHLTRPMAEPVRSADGLERLTGDSGARRVLDLDVPVITLPVMAGRNLAVLSEAAARVHILRAKGVDPAAAFMARHSHFLERAT